MARCSTSYVRIAWLCLVGIITLESRVASTLYTTTTTPMYSQTSQYGSTTTPQQPNDRNASIMINLDTTTSNMTILDKTASNMTILDKTASNMTALDKTASIVTTLDKTASIVTKTVTLETTTLNMPTTITPDVTTLNETDNTTVTVPDVTWNISPNGANISTVSSTSLEHGIIATERTISSNKPYSLIEEVAGISLLVVVAMVIGLAIFSGYLEKPKNKFITANTSMSMRIRLANQSNRPSFENLQFAQGDV